MPVLVEGAVDFSVEGSQAHLSANGVRLDLQLDNLNDFWRATGFSKRQTARCLFSLARALQSSGHSLCVHSKVQPVVLIGKEAKPGLLLRVLGVPAFEVKHRWLFLRACLA